MPALSAVLEEAHAWALEGGCDAGAVLGVPPQWEWVTAAVWTCLRSCQGEENVAWLEQPVSVVHESYVVQ